MPKLASLPHASPTNVTFMSSFSQGHPPSRLSSRLSTQSPGPLWTESHQHTQTQSLTHATDTVSSPSLTSPLSLPHLVPQPSSSTRLCCWFSLNLFHILPKSYFWLLCSPCLHYQEYISCQFILRLDTTKESLSLGDLNCSSKECSSPKRRSSQHFLMTFSSVDLSLHK